MKIVNYYLDEDIVTPQDILPDDKRQNGYRSEIEVEKGMTKATKDDNDRKKKTRRANQDSSVPRCAD